MFKSALKAIFIVFIRLSESSDSYKHLKKTYKSISAALIWLSILFGCFIVILVMYKSRSALGLPMGKGSLEGIRLLFLTWLFICLISIPVSFYFSMVLIFGAFGLVMARIGKFTSIEAREFSLFSIYPNYWFEESWLEENKNTKL